jgi:hypothetical protein
MVDMKNPTGYQPEVGDYVRIRSNPLSWRVIGIGAENEIRLQSGQTGRIRIEHAWKLVPWREGMVRG